VVTLDRHRPEATPPTMLGRALGGHRFDQTLRITLHDDAILTGVRRL